MPIPQADLFKQVRCCTCGERILAIPGQEAINLVHFDVEVSWDYPTKACDGMTHRGIACLCDRCFDSNEKHKQLPLHLVEFRMRPGGHASVHYHPFPK